MHVKLCYKKRNGEAFTESWNTRENKTEIDLTQYLTLWALKRTVTKNGITGIIGAINFVGTMKLVLQRRGGGYITAEDRPACEISPCGIYGGKSDTDKFAFYPQ